HPVHTHCKRLVGAVGDHRWWAAAPGGQPSDSGPAHTVLTGATGLARSPVLTRTGARRTRATASQTEGTGQSDPRGGAGRKPVVVPASSPMGGSLYRVDVGPERGGEVGRQCVVSCSAWRSPVSPPPNWQIFPSPVRCVISWSPRPPP